MKFRLSTAITMMLMVGCLMWFNVRPDKEFSSGTPQWVSLHKLSYGRPFIAYIEFRNLHPIGMVPDGPVIQSEWKIVPLVGDVVISVLFVVLSGFALERILFRKLD